MLSRWKTKNSSRCDPEAAISNVAYHRSVQFKMIRRDHTTPQKLKITREKLYGNPI